MRTAVTYCSNILPGESWQDHFGQIKTLWQDLDLKPETLGLRLGALALQTLGDRPQLEAFSSWLQAKDLKVNLINGFPYGGFHGEVVKDKVHQPDWSKPERLEYSLQLLHVLAELLAADGMNQGGISTSPVSYRPWYAEDPMAQWAVQIMAARHLGEWAVNAHQLKVEKGLTIRLEIEPEPDGLLDDVNSTISYFQEYIWVYGKELVMNRLGVHEETALEILKEHITVCFDVCHFATLFEEPVTSFQRIMDAGIAITRAQLSNVPELRYPAKPEHLFPFKDEVYLHQAAVQLPNGRIKRFTDLPEALQYIGTNKWERLRSHFHIPLFIDSLSGVNSIQADLSTFIGWIRTNHPATMLEVETYTWHVLPPALQLGLAASISRELRWADAQ